jgi:hypothetical protein
MIKSKLPAEEVGHKPYLVPEEDSFIPPDDDSAEIKYMEKERNRAFFDKLGLPTS